MTAGQARLVLQANAVFDFAAGLLLLAGTWDGLWDALDLPQGQPAIVVLVWLVTGLPEDVDALGTILLIALTLVLGVFALLKGMVASERAEAEEIERPGP